MAHQDNTGRPSQMEKDKLDVTGMCLQDGCPGPWREHAVSCTRDSSWKAFIGIVPGGKQRLNQHQGTMPWKERKKEINLTVETHWESTTHIHFTQVVHI